MALTGRRICGPEEVCEERLKEFSGDFIKRSFKRKFVELQFLKVIKKNMKGLLSHETKKKASERMPLVVTFHPALSGIGRVIESLLPILHTSEDMKNIFPDKLRVPYRRPRNLKYELVRAKVKRENDSEKGVKKSGKLRFQICRFVDEGCMFLGKPTYFINFPFNYDSSGVVYILSCKMCDKIYVESTITSFRKRFNNYNSSTIRYRTDRYGGGAIIRTFFFDPDHNVINYMRFKIIDKTDINESTRIERFWANKLNSFIPQELNQRDFFC